MKRDLLKSLCFALILTLATVSTSLSFHADNTNTNNMYCNDIAYLFGSEFASNYLRALNVLDAFYGNLPTNRIGKAIYPDDFGGLYINESGELVVLLVESRYSNIASVTMGAFEVENINFRTVIFSYNELREAFDFLDYFIPNAVDNTAAANVDGISFDVKSNLIMVSLAVYSDNKISLFSELVFDAPFLIFHQSPGLPLHDFDLELIDYVDIDKCIDGTMAPLSTLGVRTGDGLYLRNASGA